MKRKMIEYRVAVKNKVYLYYISKPWDDDGEDVVWFKCEAAGIDQLFLKEDVAELLSYLPEHILDQQKHLSEKQKDVIRFRVTVEDKKKIEKKALAAGFVTVSEYLRRLALG